MPKVLTGKQAGAADARANAEAQSDRLLFLYDNGIKALENEKTLIPFFERQPRHPAITVGDVLPKSAWQTFKIDKSGNEKLLLRPHLRDQIYRLGKAIDQQRILPENVGLEAVDIVYRFHMNQKESPNVRASDWVWLLPQIVSAILSLPESVRVSRSRVKAILSTTIFTSPLGLKIKIEWNSDHLRSHDHRWQDLLRSSTVYSVSGVRRYDSTSVGNQPLDFLDATMELMPLDRWQDLVLQLRHHIATQTNAYQQDLGGLIYERELVLLDWFTLKRLKREALTGESSYKVYVPTEAERASLRYDPHKLMRDYMRPSLREGAHPRHFAPMCRPVITANPRMEHFKRYSLDSYYSLYLYSHPTLGNEDVSKAALDLLPDADWKRTTATLYDWVERMDTAFETSQCSHPHCCYNTSYKHGLLAPFGSISPYDPDEMLCLEHIGEAIFCKEMLGIKDKAVYHAELMNQAHFMFSRQGPQLFPFDRIAAAYLRCPGPCATQHVIGDPLTYRSKDKYNGCRFSEGIHFVLCYPCRKAEAKRTQELFDSKKSELAEGQSLSDLPIEDRFASVHLSEDSRSFVPCGHRDLNPTSCKGRASFVTISTADPALYYDKKWICKACASLICPVLAGNSAQKRGREIAMLFVKGDHVAKLKEVKWEDKQDYLHSHARDILPGFWIAPGTLLGILKRHLAGAMTADGMAKDREFVDNWFRGWLEGEEGAA